MKIRAMVATGSEPLKNGQLSELALESLRTTAVGKPTLFNFQSSDEIGEITAAYILDDSLFCEAVITGCKIESTLYLVPGFVVKAQRRLENNGYIIEEAEVFAFALTTHPIDRGLTPIEIIEDDQNG